MDASVIQNLVQGLIIKGYLSRVKNDPLHSMNVQNMNSMLGLNNAYALQL